MGTNVARTAMLGAMLAFQSRVQGAEYSVSNKGTDAGKGAIRETALLPIQKGVDALKPGDMLTIGPGERLESARHAKKRWVRGAALAMLLPGVATIAGGGVAMRGLPFSWTSGQQKRIVLVRDEPFAVVCSSSFLPPAQREPHRRQVPSCPDDHP